MDYQKTSMDSEFQENLNSGTIKTTISNTALKQQRKKRQTMENRIQKMHSKFVSERYQHYQNKLNSLQVKLTAMHELKNDDIEFNRMNRDLEEERDLELVKLRLYEEYRISRVNKEFQQEIEEAKLEYEKIVTNLKKKLFESVEKQIKSLQEEKILLDVANEKNYSMDKQTIAEMKQTFNDDIFTYNKTRSGKGSYVNTGSYEDLKAAFITAAAVVVGNGENYDSVGHFNDHLLSNLSDGFMSDKNTNGVTSDDLLGGLLSGGTNDIKRSLRRRITTKNGAGKHMDDTGDEDYNENTFSDQIEGRNFKSAAAPRKRRGIDDKKNEEEELTISPEWLYEIQKYESLKNILMDPNNLNFTFSLFDNSTANGDAANVKSSQGTTRRYERKQVPKTAPKLQGLDKDEVTDDLNLIRKHIGKKTLPY